jgi:predicted ATPase/DNA-binding SARP family transcriptional activator
MEGTVRLRFLGTVRVERDGELVGGFRSRKALAVLGYLALQGQPLPREHLADLFWADQPEARGRANLSWVLSRITSLLPGCLQADRQSVQFRCPAHLWLDIVAFAELEARGDAASLAAAAELVRGEFLEGLYLEGCAEFELWLVGERERWRQRVVSVLRALVAHHDQEGQHAEALRSARRLLDLEPWHEETHRQVMLLLARSGQRGAALAQYEACRQVLAGELGVEPAQETVALYERLRATARRQERRRNIPSPPTPLIGREAELAQIFSLLQDPALRLLNLVGPGGIGKTRLALEAAAQIDQAGVFLEGVAFVPLSPIASADLLVTAIAGSLDFLFHSSTDPQEQLLNYLQGKEMLLVLDNFEHLLEGASLLVEILAAAPEVKLLVTSREQLNLQSEWLLEIEGLRYPADGEMEGAADYGAVELFVQSARQVQRNLCSTEEAMRSVVTICHLVQGMPLGILLATAWLDVLTPAEIADQISGGIEGSLDFLAADLRDLPERQRSIRAVFDHSWALLPRREQELFQSLSAFRGGFSRHTAQQICGASLRDLKSLAAKSLLHLTPAPTTRPTTEGRYELHALLQQYATERLEMSPAAHEAVHDRHCAYYATALQQWAADLKGHRQQRALAEMDVEIENARAAWYWALKQRAMERLAQALEGLCLFYDWHLRYQEGEATCRAGVERLEATVSGAGLQILTSLLTWQAYFCTKLGRRKAASQILEQSLAILDGSDVHDTGYRRAKAHTLRVSAELARDSDREGGRRLYAQSLALFQELGDQWWTARVLQRLGWAAWQLGDYNAARRWLGESLVHRQTLGDQRGIGQSLELLSYVPMYRGEFEEAERLLRESLAIHQEIGRPADIAEGWVDLGCTLSLRGKFSEARLLHRESVAIYEDLGSPAGLAWSSIWLGLVEMHLGRYNSSQTLAQTSLASARELGHQEVGGLCLFVLANVALARGAYSEANALAQKSASIFRGIGQQHELAMALASMGYAALGLGQRPQAGRHLSEALRIATEVRVFRPLMLALPAIALLLASEGRLEQAVELYSLASRHDFVAKSQWFQDVAGQQLATTEAALPPNTVAAARERAHTQDQWDTAAQLLVELGERQDVKREA